MGILLNSNMLGPLIGCYLFLFLILFVSFVNIYSVDKYEFQNNIQRCVEFKGKLFFIIHYSKHKHIVSLKTFVMEVIGYVLAVSLLVVLLCSLKLTVTISYILMAIMAFIVLIFGCITGCMYRKTRKKKRTIIIEKSKD